MLCFGALLNQDSAGGMIRLETLIELTCINSRFSSCFSWSRHESWRVFPRSSDNYPVTVAPLNSNFETRWWFSGRRAMQVCTGFIRIQYFGSVSIIRGLITQCLLQTVCVTVIKRKKTPVPLTYTPARYTCIAYNPSDSNTSNTANNKQYTW